ncbi:MAG TPA: hypothetical protein VG675_14290 [Bryobacteraceae bacterium]|nr:hypothetical protein [Bryobacteraceae bacterium]
MKVAIDASVLIFIFNPKAPASVDRASERVSGLVETLSRKKAKIIIPTPALAEIMMAGRAISEYIEGVRQFSCFQVRAFDERAAIELAARLGNHQKKNRRRFKKVAAWNKIKFDRQIVAVAKSQGAQAVYSDDIHVRKFALECGMDAHKLGDLPIPPKQERLRFEKDEEPNNPQTPNAKPVVLQRGDSGHSQGQARTETEEKAKGKEAGEI